MVLAVASMRPGEFTSFALISLVGAVILGLGRSALFQPALIQQRVDSRALVPFKYTALAAACAALIMGAAAAIFGIRDPAELGVLAASASLPTFLDWLRFRRIAVDDRWAVAWADAFRLATVLAALPFAFVTEDASRFQSYLQLACLVPIAFLAIKHRPIPTWAPYGSYSRAAGLQLSDFVIGQANSTLPLLLLGGLGASALLAGVRFAQTIFGPLNLIASASVMNLMADGATRATHTVESRLIKHGQGLSWQLGVASVLYAGVALLVVQLPGLSVSGISQESLKAGIMLVGAVAIVSGWAGIHSIILRLLGEQVVATVARTVLVALTLSAFFLGYLWGGVDTSLATGFLTSAVLYPLVFVVPAQVVYRRLLRDKKSEQSGAEE